jgi:hypothetical protein
VALTWSALGAQAFARGLALESCGCFGVHLGQPLRWWVLLEDVELIVWSVLVWRRIGAASLADPEAERARPERTPEAMGSVPASPRS